MKRIYETDKVKKSDFTVKVLRVESSVNTLTNHCENALYEVNADIYYKGNRIESFFCLCPFGKCKNSEPDENGEKNWFLEKEIHGWGKSWLWNRHELDCFDTVGES